MKTRLKLKSNIAISDSGFLFNPSSGDSFSSNHVGLTLIELLKKGIAKKDALNAVSKKYNISAEDFEKDFDDFIVQLKSFDLINEKD
jgi:hydroxymethylpyrimidine pyrophosphatase-like HAD family hydrolase